MIKYSFIIPVFQTKNYLKKCVDSILSQTFSNFEIILIDDGSTDGSEILCDEYSKKDNRIKCIHKLNERQGEARNKGIEIAKGEYIFFVDSDDCLINETVLEKIDSIINGCDVVFFDSVYKKNNSNISFGFTDGLLSNYSKGELFLVDLLKRKPSFPWFPFLYVFKRKMWIEKKISFPKNTYFEDTATIYKIPLFAENVNVLNRDIYLYTEDRKTSTTKYISKRLLNNHINVFTNTIRYINTLLLNDDLKKRLLNNIACGYIDTLNYVFFLAEKDRNIIYKSLNDNIYVLDYIIYGKQKYMAIIVKIFGLKCASAVFGLIKKIRVLLG